MSDLISSADNIIPTGGSMYERIIRAGFYRHYRPGMTEFIMRREEIDGTAQGLSPKNIGDIIYSFRYRRSLPEDIRNCAPTGRTWIIEGAGDGLYRFKAVVECDFTPNLAIIPMLVQDRTPEDVVEHGNVRDEQVVLASIAYNRLLDLFLHCRLERKQSHWRTKIQGVGQIEIDDVYVGIDGQTGNRVVVTVQAKRDKDKVNSVQISQDIRACVEKGDGRVCRPVAVHYNTLTGRLACFEFEEIEGTVSLKHERHYILMQKPIIF